MSTNPELSDEELMKAYQQGDESAFKELYTRYASRVYGYVYKRTPKSSADDVYQNAWLKLHRSRRLFNSSFPFGPWLFMIVRQSIVDVKRIQIRSLEDSNSDFVADAVASPSSTGGALPQLGTLPSTQQKALQLRYEQDLSFEEIARTLGTSPSNVRQLVSRALRSLKKSFGKERA